MKKVSEFMKRKVISILLSFAIAVSVFSVLDAGIFTVNALDLKKKGDYEYFVDSSNNVTITSYRGHNRKVTIPSEIDGMPVVEIYDYCFNGDSRRVSVTDDSLEKHPNRFFNRIVKSVVIPSTVITIGENAFGNMDRLEEVVFSEGLTTIEEYAFAECPKLKEINLPDSLVNFTLLSFDGTPIEELTLGTNVTEPDLTDDQGTSIKRIICNADGVSFEKVSLNKNSALEEIVCNGTFLGGNLKGSSVKRIVCNGRVYYQTVVSMVSKKFTFCSDVQGENIVFSTLDADIKKTYKSGGFKYYLNEKSEAVISGYTGNDVNVTVPEKLGSYKVTAIAPLAFSSLNFSKLKNNTDGKVTSDKLLSVTLPDTVESIGSFAFAYSIALESVNIPDGVQIILEDCFLGCESIKSVSLPDSVRGIKDSAFEDCKLLESVQMKGVVNIGNKAFEQCYKLENVAYSDKLKSIGESAFYFCNLTGDFDLSSVEKIGEKAFGFNQNIKKVVLNDNLTVLENSVFYNCRALEEINFPSKLVSIGDSCFYQSSISNTSFGKNIKEIGAGAFTFCKLKGTLDLSTVEKIGEYAFSWNTGISKVILCDELTELKYGGFQFCVGLKEINFPSELVKIDNHCFRGVGLSTAIFGENLKEIGTGAFLDCTELSTLKLPESIEKIGNFAFEGTKLQILTIPKNLSVIGYGAFRNCSELETLYFNAKNCTVDRYRNIEGDLDLENLQNSAPFYGCNIKEIFLGDGINSIGGDSKIYGTFENCSELEKIIIPDTVYEIGTAAFKNCESLETAVISDSVTSVADNAFEGCDNLTILCFEDSYIYEYAQNNGIAVSTFLVSPIPNQTYTGKAITPEITVTFSGNTLHKYIDFGVTYSNNINVGEADVTVKGKGDYKNFSNKTKFTIVTKNISSAVISPIADQAYTGDAVTPELIVTDSSNILCEGVDYTASYSNNEKEGTATVVVTGKGNYSGSVSAEFQIVKMTDTENFFSRMASAINSFFVRMGAFFKEIFT